MHVEFTVKLGKGQKTICKTWFIEATQNKGPQIPVVPAILMAEKILTQPTISGVKACVKLIKLEEYLQELEQFDPHTFQTYIL